MGADDKSSIAINKDVANCSFMCFSYLEQREDLYDVRKNLAKGPSEFTGGRPQRRRNPPHYANVIPGHPGDDVCSRNTAEYPKTSGVEMKYLVIYEKTVTGYS